MNPAPAPPPKSVLVTGGASGIGRATAIRFAGCRLSVAVADLNLTGARETVHRIMEAGHEGFVVPLDVTSEPDWEKALRDVAETHGGIAVLVNCAGVASAGPLDELTLDEWRRIPIPARLPASTHDAPLGPKATAKLRSVG